MTPRERFAANLKALRQHAGKSQAETSEALCMSRSSYSGYETGVAEPDLGLLVRIAKHYELSLDTLLRREITFQTGLHNIRMDGTRMLVGMQIL